MTASSLLWRDESRDTVVSSARIFLLSPARCDGARAVLLASTRTSFDLALELRSSAGAPIGEVFSFLSGLYFRGKLAYSTRFAVPCAGVAGTLVITADRGLVTPDHRFRREDILTCRDIDIAQADPRFLEPLTRDVDALARAVPDDTAVVLLGSIATGKYVDRLQSALGDRLRFPLAFVGRGDMSRGGLLLRCARSGEELEYAPIGGAVRRGARPPKLSPLR